MMLDHIFRIIYGPQFLKIDSSPLTQTNILIFQTGLQIYCIMIGNNIIMTFLCNFDQELRLRLCIESSLGFIDNVDSGQEDH